jgi:hypothetical protein
VSFKKIRKSPNVFAKNVVLAAIFEKILKNLCPQFYKRYMLPGNAIFFVINYCDIFCKQTTMKILAFKILFFCFGRKKYKNTFSLEHSRKG